MQSPSGGPSTNPFLSSPTNNADQPIVDLFGAPTSAAADSQVNGGFSVYFNLPSFE